MEITDTLSRFLSAQESSYAQALAEIKRGRKTSHWMWFIFLQIQGLGHSETAKFYAIRHRAEAMLENPDPVFQQVLDRFYAGKKDGKTAALMHQR